MTFVTFKFQDYATVLYCKSFKMQRLVQYNSLMLTRERQFQDQTLLDLRYRSGTSSRLGPADF